MYLLRNVGSLDSKRQAMSFPCVFLYVSVCLYTYIYIYKINVCIYMRIYILKCVRVAFRLFSIVELK